MASITRILKRNGNIVAYDRERITIAVHKATASTGKPDRALAERMAELVEHALAAAYAGAMMPSVEDIQDIVEQVLLEHGQADLARNYIAYRQQRAMRRATKAYSFEVTDNIPYKKIYEVLLWNMAHRCESVEALNKIVADGGFPDLVAAKLDAEGKTRSRIRLTKAAREAGLTADDARGLLYDRDVLAFYGDPAWAARMADRPKAWDQSLTETNGLWTLEVTPKRGEHTFEPISENGSQRGGRPIVEFFPRRLEAVQVIKGAELEPVITDRFILMPNPHGGELTNNYRIVFRAKASP